MSRSILSRAALGACLAMLCAGTVHAQSAAPVPFPQASALSADSELLKAREAVWRAWFANDAQTLKAMVPPETIVMSAGEEPWKSQSEVLDEAVDFQKQGGKLLRLEFPRTEVQHFGDVAIIWSQYLIETSVNGKTSVSHGRVTEIFVRRAGRWLNPGWHTSHD